MRFARENVLKELMEMQKRMNSVIDALMHSPIQVPEFGYRWVPPADIFEEHDSFVIEIEVPGISIENTELIATHNIVSIMGRRDLAEGISKENYHCIERYYGTFERRFELPEPIDPDKVSAQMNDGILIITAPKKTKEKKIRVT